MCNYIRIIARKAQELGDVSWVPTQPFIWKHLVYIGTLDEKETVFQWIWFSFCWWFFLFGLFGGFFWWMWLWCHHQHYIPVSKEYSSNLKAPCPHRSWLFLACHTSTCTLARNKTAPASNFLAFVSIKQSCNSILNRMLTLFFFFFFQWCYERNLSAFSYHRVEKWKRRLKKGANGALGDQEEKWSLS